LNGYEYIVRKQIAWAKREGIPLVGSQGERGRPTYVPQLDMNLFRPLLPEVRQAFSEGDGGELAAKGEPAKMQALHSSSALAVNVFQYWKQIAEVPVIAAACGLCQPGSTSAQDLVFEEKYPVNEAFEKSPNIDVVIHNREGSRIRRLAIECKFSEAYGNRHSDKGLKTRYLEECGPLWEDIPALRELAETISPHDKQFQHLHPAQLIKHILGLKRAFGRTGFRLLYLWYDVLGPDGDLHHKEVETFATAARGDGVMFHSLTYQDLILGMAEKLAGTHSEYLGYVTNRYA